MNAAFHTTTTVLPGHKIEITAPELKEGAEVQVVVITSPPTAAASKPGPSFFDIVASLNGHRLFQSSEEVDRSINEEWDS